MAYWPAISFDDEFFDRPARCAGCGWSGTFRDAIIEYGCVVRCPVCTKPVLKDEPIDEPAIVIIDSPG